MFWAPASLADPHLRAGVSGRTDGSMRLRVSGVVDEAGLSRRRAYLERMTPPRQLIAAPLCVHGAAVAVVRGHEPLQAGHALFSETDATVTNVPGVTLTVTAADCLPVFFSDPARRVIGLAHAGWRGLVAPPNGVLAATVEALVGLGSRPQDLRVEIGPSVGPCHYAVDAERRALFTERFGAAVIVDEALDLRKAAVIALLRCGLDPAHIAANAPCTACQADRFFSRRADGREPPDINMGWISLLPPAVALA